MDYNIDEHNLNMTIYYSKRTGAIKSYATGLQDMSTYGDSQEDMEIIYDYIQTTKNDNFINNWRSYKIDTATKQLVKIVTSLEEQTLTSLQSENTALKSELELVKTVLDTLIMGA